MRGIMNTLMKTKMIWRDIKLILLSYNYSGDYRNSRALIGREWRHIPL